MQAIKDAAANEKHSTDKVKNHKEATAKIQADTARARAEVVHEESGPRAVHPLDEKLDAMRAELAELRTMIATATAAATAAAATPRRPRKQRAAVKTGR